MMPVSAEQPVVSRAAAAGKEGVAIILVLGMLALLMLMGVAFSVTMRIERVGAGNFAKNVNTRQLVWGGLARAIDDINAEMEDLPGNTNFIYPTWEVMPSSSSSGGGSTTLSWGKIKEYLPGSLRDAAGESAQWVEIATDSAGGTGGRAAYMVVNLSDCLDANEVGGSTVRGFGTNSAALQIGVLSDVTDAAIFAANRVNDSRYETLPEFNDLQRVNFAAPPDAPGLTSDISDNFVTYSRYPQGFWDGSNVNTTAPIYIGGDTNDLNSQRGAIIAALRQSVNHDYGGAGQPLPVAEATAIFNNLLDYVDTDSIPQDLASPCTERVPMLNEIYPFVGMGGTPGSLAFGGQIRTELIFPFAEPASSRFDVGATVDIIITERDGGVDGAVYSNTVVVAPMNSNYDPSAGHNCFFTATPPAPVYTVANLSLGTVNIPSTNSNFRIELAVSAEVRLDDGSGTGDIVDQVPAGGASGPLLFSGDYSLGTVLVVKSLEAVDPRFNWKGSGQHWFPTSAPEHTLNLINAHAESVITMNRADLNTLGYDWDLDMRVSNSGSLKAVGELGYLLRGSSLTYMMQSVRLYGIGAKPPDRVLDYFTVDATIDPVRRGLCNLNSINQQRLAVGFYGTDFSYPGRPGAALSAVNARDIADQIIAWRREGNRFDRLSDIGNFDWREDLTALGPRTDNELESLIVHSAGLFGVRQNLFGILIAARSVAAGMGTVANNLMVGSWQSSQRAFVTVWRDPFPDAEGQNRCFVQDFQWITED